MKKILDWLITPFEFLPWYHALLVGTSGGFIVGVTVGVLIATIFMK